MWGQYDDGYSEGGVCPNFPDGRREIKLYSEDMKSKASQAGSNLAKRAQVALKKKYTKEEISEMRRQAAIKRWKTKTKKK